MNLIGNRISWPDGARCAVAMTFDMDADSILHLVHHASAHNRVKRPNLPTLSKRIALNLSEHTPNDQLALSTAYEASKLDANFAQMLTGLLVPKSIGKRRKGEGAIDYRLEPCGIDGTRPFPAAGGDFRQSTPVALPA